MLPIVSRWTGEEFTPLGRSRKDCDAQLIAGQIYRIEIVEQRSEANHRHYFATVNEAWANLPEDMAQQFPNPEMFRKFCLIKTGYCTQEQHVAATRAEAQRMRAFAARITSNADDYSIVSVDGTVVTVWRAESQSYRHMGKKRFTESKQATLEYMASLIGVSSKELTVTAGQAA